ncbi:hypothetical protein PFDG_04655 [Plasmodium falciparum Dd2]|uniref:Uncharacterized protein n=1 Tax=Plasmodium falciparum (isolate Dd2) TaxID=57267 RepID=A0A0L7M5J7_PLAF4|nr:hypothetical protein PFDG_04655 [Plasmodium falciparum Dd2]
MAVEMNTPVSKKGVSSTAYSIYFSVFLKRLESYVSDRISRIKNATDYEKPCRDLNYEIDGKCHEEKKKEEDPEIVEDGDGKKPEDSKNIVKSIHGPSFGTTYNYSPRQLEYGNNAFFLPRSNSDKLNFIFRFTKFWGLQKITDVKFHLVIPPLLGFHLLEGTIVGNTPYGNYTIIYGLFLEGLLNRGHFPHPEIWIPVGDGRGIHTSSL